MPHNMIILYFRFSNSALFYTSSLLSFYIDIVLTLSSSINRKRTRFAKAIIKLSKRIKGELNVRYDN